MPESPDGGEFKKMFLFGAHSPALNVQMAFSVSVCHGLNFFFIAGQEQSILKTATTDGKDDFRRRYSAKKMTYFVITSNGEVM